MKLQGDGLDWVSCLRPVEGLLGYGVSRPRLRYGLGCEEKYVKGELGLAWGKDLI
jgi:hypothetical protein